MQELQCKVGLIFGGAGCIGSKLCKELISNGLKAVVIADIDLKGGKRVVDDLEECFGINRAKFVQTNIAKSEDVLRAFNKVSKYYKQLDYVVNTAGMIDECNWSRMVDVDLIGAIQILKFGFVYIPKLKLKQDGTVLTVTSNIGLTPLPTIATYSGISNHIMGVGRSYGALKYFKKYKTHVTTAVLGPTEGPFYEKYKDLFRDANLPVQKSDQVVTELISILKDPINGGIYEIEDGKPHFLKFKTRHEMHAS